MKDESESKVRLFSFAEDQPNEERGALIPRSISIDEVIVDKVDDETYTIGVQKFAKLTLLPVAAVAALVLVTLSSSSLLSQGQSQAAAPVLTILDPYTDESRGIAYGTEEAFQAESLFSSTHDAFIEQAYSFLSLDLEKRILRYFDNGVLMLNEPIISVGAEGSWWETPSGLYHVEATTDEKFSTYAQVYFPHAVTFEGNYVVHGWPLLPNREPVSEAFVGGGVRVSDTAAKKLQQLIDVDTPVLVRGERSEPVEAFVYQEPAEGVSAAHYLVADIDTGAVLTSSDVTTSVPVASITKLMTAIVAAEQMDLDQRVYQETPTFVDSLIPRLRDRTTVSMYSLLQLLLLESSNEAAEVIAREYGRDDFISEMNDKARAIGMFDTTFVDPSGLGAGNISSLRDLLTLTQYIYEERSFIFEITNTGEAVGVAGGGEFSDLTNFNEIETTGAFIGGKIGETLAAGLTSVSLHTITVQGTERDVAVIILASEARDADVETLLEQVRDRFNQ